MSKQQPVTNYTRLARGASITVRGVRFEGIPGTSKTAEQKPVATDCRCGMGVAVTTEGDCVTCDAKISAE